MWWHSHCAALRYMNAMEVWSLWDSCMSFLPSSNNSTNRRFIADGCSFLRFSIHQRGFLHGYNSFTCHLLLCTWCNPEEMQTIVRLHAKEKQLCSWQVKAVLWSERLHFLFMIKQILYLLEFTISPEASCLTSVTDVPLEAFNLEVVVFFSSCNWNWYIKGKKKQT